MDSGVPEGACSHGADDKQTESARMYVFEEESLKASHLNPEETQDAIAELMHSQDSLKKLNLELQRSVSVADDQYSALQTENMALSSQLKSLKEKLHKSQKLGEELDEVRRASSEMDATIRSQGNCIRKMERENQALKAQDEKITREMSTVSAESEKNKGKIANLTNALQALQQQLDEYRFSLDKNSQELHEKSVIIKEMESTTEEYITIIQELRTQNKELEGQLEKARMFVGPNMHQPMSIAAELGQLPHSNVEFSDVEGELEKEQELHELHIEEEEGPVLDAQNRSWWRRHAKHLWKGLKRVGTFCLGVILSLGVMACMGPQFDLRTIHPDNSDIMGTLAHYLFHPYCTCHNFGMPPV